MDITCELYTASYTEAIRAPLTQNVKVVSYHVSVQDGNAPSIEDPKCEG